MELEPKFSEPEVRDAVRRLAREISDAYQDKCPILVGVLKGAFVFLADLARELTIPFEVDFIRARSYGQCASSSGEVRIIKDIESDVTGRHVLVIEDIADTGLTLETVVAQIQRSAPASVRRCALLARRGSSALDFVGLTLDKGFVVGYGLDYAERYRGLRDIRVLAVSRRDEAGQRDDLPKG